MRDYYAEFLQTKISFNTPVNGVSKVAKGQKSDSEQAFDTFATSLPTINQKIYAPQNNEDLEEIKTDYFHRILNRFIKNGITFEVSADDFHFIDEAQKLKLSDLEFLKLNNADVLCHLQQSLLMKHLFNHSPELLDDFAFEIKERESLLTITDKTPFEIYEEAIKDTTMKWFTDLLEKKT